MVATNKNVWSIQMKCMVITSEMYSVRATLPPSTLFADSMLPQKGYTISIPKA